MVVAFMLGSLRLVLLRPRNAENLGAAARAMKNFGLADWVWVEAREMDLAPARKLAVHAEDVLEGVRRVESLTEAVADCAWIVGTSSRKVAGKRRISPREFAVEAVRRASTGRVALVFGDERSGLTNDDLQSCHDLSAVPTNESQPSINLAQALLLYAYELRIAALASAPPRPAPRATPATDGQLRQLEELLTIVLQRGHFLVHKERHALRDLLATLTRAQLSRREADLWMAALAKVAKSLDR
jgi:tRNA/rRNA methyltransferase/tRNA (cytidine32/uridine32-2'-O)-methyltransferase